MPAVDDLVREYQPVVRFDSQEAFFAHDVRAMADNANFRLTRADQRESPSSSLSGASSALCFQLLIEHSPQLPIKTTEVDTTFPIWLRFTLSGSRRGSTWLDPRDELRVSVGELARSRTRGRSSSSAPSPPTSSNTA